MELYKEISVNILKNTDVEVIFKNLSIDAKEIVEMACYKSLSEIKQILADTSLSDNECFEKIEEIVCVFEALGSNGGSRHDFG